jgi:hypothetical protein
VNRTTLTLFFVLCICHRLAFAQTDWPEIFAPNPPRADNLFPNAFTRIDGMSRDLNPPAKQIFAMELGPKWVEFRGTYFERRQGGSSPTDLPGDAGATNWGRYVDLLATSSRFGGKLVGEGELAYSTLAPATAAEQHPLMTRLGVKGQWGKFGYGLSYGSSARGFVSPNGAMTEHDRDATEIYTEYDFGLFRVRGAAGEAWEMHSETHEITLTQTAATSVYLNKANWSATFSSSYSLIGHGDPSNAKTPAFTNGLALVYRPVAPLRLEPSINFKQEWDALTGQNTETPSAAFALAYSPIRDFELNGRASYAIDLSLDPLKKGSLLNTTAALNWKIGKSFLGEQFLSLQVEYKEESRATLPSNSQSNVAGTVQFKINGF